MTAAGWRPTVDAFLGRVTKARILRAVAEAKGQRAADRIAHLKKGDMAAEAETLLAGTGWLPEPLRTQSGASANMPAPDINNTEAGVGGSAAEGGTTAMVDVEPSEENELADDAPHTLADE